MGSEAFGLAVDGLRTALHDPRDLAAVIRRFQSAVWDSSEWREEVAPESVEVLTALAYDLDFFEPDPALRKEDLAYFGDDRALQEIRDALARL